MLFYRSIARHCFKIPHTHDSWFHSTQHTQKPSLQQHSQSLIPSKKTSLHFHPFLIHCPKHILFRTIKHLKHSEPPFCHSKNQSMHFQHAQLISFLSISSSSNHFQTPSQVVLECLKRCFQCRWILMLFYIAIARVKNVWCSLKIENHHILFSTFQNIQNNLQFFIQDSQHWWRWSMFMFIHEAWFAEIEKDSIQLNVPKLVVPDTTTVSITYSNTFQRHLILFILS